MIMAYGELYRFVFDAANGPEVTISVAKKYYTGAVYRRAVGGSATLRREVVNCFQILYIRSLNTIC